MLTHRLFASLVLLVSHCDQTCAKGDCPLRSVLCSAGRPILNRNILNDPYGAGSTKVLRRQLSFQVSELEQVFRPCLAFHFLLPQDYQDSQAFSYQLKLKVLASPLCICTHSLTSPIKPWTALRAHPLRPASPTCRGTSLQPASMASATRSPSSKWGLAYSYHFV